MSRKPKLFEPRLMTMAELSDLFGRPERTLRDWLHGLPPDERGAGGRGQASRWAVHRVLRHLGYPLPWVEIGVRFKFTRDQVRELGDMPGMEFRALPGARDLTA